MDNVKIKRLWNKTDIEVEFNENEVSITCSLSEFKEQLKKRIFEQLPNYGLNLNSNAIREDVTNIATKVFNELIAELKNTTR